MSATGHLFAESKASMFDDAAGGHILVVDDHEGNRNLLARVLSSDGHTVFRAESGDQALALVSERPIDLILLDVMMPGLTGFDVCRQLKGQPSTRLLPIILVTALQEADGRIRGFDAGADELLVKPFNIQELRARVRSLLRLKRFTDDLDSADAVLMSLALTIETRDACTEGHCQRLAAYAVALGQALDLSAVDLESLHYGGFLHDIGKVGIPDAVLLKPGRLTADEYALMRQHTVIGDRLCGNLRSLARVRPIVRHHHERPDGTGYPDGLRGDSIPRLAQIMSIVDYFDAVRTARPYKPAQSVDDAIDALRGEAARGWKSSELVETFVRLVQDGRIPRFDPNHGSVRRAS